MKDSRLQRAKVNAVTSLLHQLIATVCGLVIPWIMINKFGSVAYGATTSIAQFLSYITLFEGGIGRAARGELYKPLADGDNEGISRIYYAIKRFFTGIGAAFLLYTLVIAVSYRYIADVTEFTWGYIFILVIIISLGKFAEYMGGIANVTLFNADQRQYFVNTVIIGSNILNSITVILLVSFGCDLLWVKLGSSLVFVAKPFFYTAYLKKHYTLKKTKEKAKLKNRWTGLGQHLAYFIQTNTDVLVLTVFADLRYVAVYSVYYLVTFSIRNITTSFTGGMEAMFGNMIAKNETQTLNNSYKRYKLLLTIITITLFGAASMLIVPFVKLYTSGANDGVNYYQPIFAIILILSDAINCLILPCFNLPIAANKLKESRMGAYGEAAINLCTSCILVFWNPLLGIAIGTLCSAVFKSVFYMVYSGKNILHIKVSRMLLEFFVCVISLLALAITGLFVLKYIDITNYFIWAVCGVVAVLFSGTIACVIGKLMYPVKLTSVLKSLLKRG